MNHFIEKMNKNHAEGRAPFLFIQRFQVVE